MKRFRPVILGTVSAFTLLAAATASQALVAPVMNLGTLKAEDQWKVGTVDAGKLSYCAMVGKFDKQVVLAVARSPGGMGSLAIDFREKFFEPGASYDVVLTPNSGRMNRLTARASSDRAVVVQIGEDEQFFRDLSAGGDLELSMPTLDTSFALHGFAASYKDLVSCTNHLTESSSSASAAASVAPAAGGDDAALAPIDKEAAAITAGKGVKTADAAPPVQPKADSFQSMENELDQEAATESKTSSKKIAALDDKVQSLQKQVAAQKAAEPIPAPPVAVAVAPPAPVVSVPVAAPPAVVAETTAPQQLIPPRKLIASTQGVGTVSSVTSVPLAADSAQEEAQAMESQEIARRSAESKQQVAALDAEKAIVASSTVADSAKADAQIDTKIAAAETQRDSVKQKLQQAPADSNLRADLASAQARIAQLTQQKASETAALSQKLAATQSAYESRLAQLQAERDGLKQQLASAQTSASKAAEAKLVASEQQKSDLTARLDALDKQNKLMQAALSGKEQEVATAKGSAGELASVRGQMAALQSSHTTQVAALQKKLDDKSAQYDALKTQFDATRTAQASTADQGTRVAALEQQLKDAQTARQAEADSAAKTQADLAAARQQLAALSSSLNAPVHAEKTSSLSPSEKAELEEYRHSAVAHTPVAAIAPPAMKAPEEIADAALPPPVTSPAALEPAAGSVAVVKVATPVVVPVPVETAAVAPKHPSAFEGYKRMDPQGYAVPVQQASADNFPVPAVPAIPVEQQGMVPEAQPVSGNRAADFLEKIMSYHRPGGVVAVSAPSKVDVAAPTLSAADKVEPPVVKTAEVIPPPPVVPVVKETTVAVQQPVAAQATEASELARVETSAGPAAVAKIEPPAQKETPVAAKPEPAVAPATPVKLENLLHDAGLKDFTMTPVAAKQDNTVYQWTSGALNGMYERTADSGEGFGKQANAYLDRYREDCPGKLHVALGDTQATPAGHMATANISCTATGNAYTSSFVFLQDGATFAAVLHTATPSSAAEVKSAGDSIASALKSSGPVTTEGLPQAVAVAAVVPAPVPVEQMPEIQPAAGAPDGTSTAANDGEFQTRVVQ